MMQDVAAALPPGRTRADVKAWADSRHLELVRVSDGGDMGPEYRKDCLRSLIGSTPYRLYQRSGVFVYFFFDDRNKLVETVWCRDLVDRLAETVWVSDSASSD
jgi:hypothetical protein